MPENVGASTSRNPKGHHSLYRDNITFFLDFTTFFLAGFLLGLFFDPEDGSDIFFPKVSYILIGYTTLYPRNVAQLCVSCILSQV
jgi:hypothetical protein